MRALLRLLLFTLVVLVILALAAWGVRTYNLNRYAIPGPDLTDRDAVIADHGGAPVDGDYLRGIHYPAEGDARPGTVVIFGGSEGSAADAQARQISARGDDVLALYFFGQPGQRDQLAEVPLDFFDEILHWRDTNGASGPLTVIGSSKGAELTANLAVRYPEIDHIVLYAPAAYTYARLSFNSAEPPGSFSWRGEPVPHAPFTADPSVTFPMFSRLILGLPTSYRDSYEAAASTAPDDAATDIARFTGDGLLFAGTEDTMWQSEVATRALANRNPDLEPVVFDAAGHLFHQDITTLGPSWEVMLGGTVDANRQARRESDRLLFEHLDQWHPRC